MKKLGGLVLILSLALNVFFLYRHIGKVRVISGPNTGAVSLSRISLFAEYPEEAQPNATVFLGDSLTEYCEWNELLNRSDILNRGISGDKTEDILARIGSVVRLKPKRLILWAGINDAYFGTVSVDQAIRNVNSIITTVRGNSPQTQIFIASILPVGRGDKVTTAEQEKTINDWVRTFNTKLSESAAMQQVQYIDLAKYAWKNDSLDPSLTVDGIHLNAFGYEMMEAVLTRSL